MTALVWSSLNAKYETGLDRGVLYPTVGPGVVWNGLVSVEETSVGPGGTPHHFDGIKYLHLAGSRAFQASLTAFGAPFEFDPCQGNYHVTPGFIVTRQIKLRFGFSYRVLIGNGLGYKLHLVYNATATPTSKPRTTVAADGEPDLRSWTIDAVPVILEGYRPTAHFVLDSTETDPDALEAIEQMLYGTTTTDPELPSIADIYDYASFYMPMGVVADPEDGLSTLVVGGDDLTGTSVPGIYLPLVETDLTDVDGDGLYTLEE
jgi:hypothetical protein